MNTPKQDELPAIPSGTEYLDMLWRDLTPLAETLLANWPTGVDAVWGTSTGVLLMVDALVSAHKYLIVLEKTPLTSTVRQIRKRQLARLLAIHHARCLSIGSALARNIRSDFPDAAPEQVLLLVGTRLRKLLCELGEEVLHQVRSDDA